MRRTTLKGIVLGLLLGACLAGMQAMLRASHWSEYQQIKLGAAWSEAYQLLSRKGIPCELVTARCAFSDPWREYLIYYDPTTKVVTGKVFAFRQTPTLLRWPPVR